VQLRRKRLSVATPAVRHRRGVYLAAVQTPVQPQHKRVASVRFPDAWGAVYRRPQLERRM